ncbi:hypothetical protein TRIUR3_17028 [Triticum urartu]|uniref:Uncharacterized protein n=1 Tax=Triticum urartu TaxID=4572 RepID=M7ZWK9_TRIUA|nr:hypothetical protein TRIUR3_17028 [Triticum urartu]
MAERTAVVERVGAAGFGQRGRTAATVESEEDPLEAAFLGGRRPGPGGGAAGGVRSATTVGRMRKGLHPQMQWISYVTQSGRLINIMMTKVNHTGKVYHMRAKRQMAQSLGQIAKFKRRYEQEAPEENQDK